MSERDQILALPISYLRYLDWHKLSAQKAKRVDFSLLGNAVPPPRFEFEGDDVVHQVPDLRVRVIGAYVLLESGQGEAVLELAQADMPRILAQLDGTVTLLELTTRLHSQNIRVEWAQLQALAGLALVVPDAVAALEAAIPGISIVRNPHSPYHIVRNYWKNMHAVRNEFALYRSQDAGSIDPSQLRQLHITALMGADLGCFYKPDSPISDYEIWPGQFRSKDAYVGDTAVEYAIYWWLIARSLGLTPAEPHTVQWQEHDLYWGKGSITAGTVAYFPPPAPFTKQMAHLCALLSDLPEQVADAGKAKAIADLAQFYQRFVQLHPFECANQSLVMNIVNYFLTQWWGLCIPHLNLDILAMFLSPTDYARYFARAVRYYAANTADAAQCYADYQQRFARMRQLLVYALVDPNTHPSEFFQDYPETMQDLLLVD